MIERAVLLCGADDRPGAPAAGDHGKRRRRRLPRTASGSALRDAREHDHAATERRLLVEALERFRGNKRAVARHLEIDPKTLYRLLKKHGIFAAGEE